jgi:hypothetical protein
VHAEEFLLEDQALITALDGLEGAEPPKVLTTAASAAFPVPWGGAETLTETLPDFIISTVILPFSLLPVAGRFPLAAFVGLLVFGGLALFVAL